MAKSSGTGSERNGVVMQALNFRASDAEAFVDILYHAILGRAPDAPGMSGYTRLITTTPDRETLIAITRSIAMSEEAVIYREHHLASHRA